MSRSTFRINKICEHCGGLFEAQKSTTRFCSHKCNQKNYKLRKKLEKKGLVEADMSNKIVSVKANAINVEVLKTKPYLTVKEVSILLNCSGKTVYRLIERRQIEAIRFSKRMIRVRYVDIEKKFLGIS